MVYERTFTRCDVVAIGDDKPCDQIGHATNVVVSETTFQNSGIIKTSQ